MKVLLQIRWLLLLSLVQCLTAVAQAQNIDDVVKVDVRLVTVNVLVTDKSGRPLPGLQAADFQVMEEGSPMRVEFFDNRGPASIVFLIDLSSSMRNEKWRNLKKGMKKFLAESHSGNDYTLVGFSDKPGILARAVKEDQLWQVIDRVKPWGNTALYDALSVGLDVLNEITRRHKALVLFSDGEDNSSRTDLATLKQKILSTRATIYTIGILGGGYQDLIPGGRSGKELLNELAEASGGRVHFPSFREIEGVLEDIRADLSSRYSLSYYATERKTGWRQVRVNVIPGQDSLKLRYQQRYLVR
jgi:VWFA-related protein